MEDAINDEKEQSDLCKTPTTPLDKPSTTPIMAKCTPAVVKARLTRQTFQVQSPSDSILSPCTKKLNTAAQPRLPASSNPVSVLRYKQQNAIKINLEDVDNAKPNADESMDTFENKK